MISNTSEAKLRIIARGAFYRTFIASMVSDILVIRIRTNIYTDLGHRIAIKRKRTLVHTVIMIKNIACVIIPESINA